MPSEPTSLPSAAMPTAPRPRSTLIALTPGQARQMGFVPFPEHRGYFRLDAATGTLWYQPMAPDGRMHIVFAPDGQPYPTQMLWETDPKGQRAAIVETLRNLPSSSSTG